MLAFLGWLRKEYRYLARFLPTTAPTRNPPTGYASLYADASGNLKVRRSDGQIVTPGGGGGSSDHATLSNLAWTSSAHTGTASRLAAFDGAGAAAYQQVGVDVARQRTLTAGSGQVTVTNGDGAAGNPTVDLAYASALRTSTGPTTLTVGAVADGQVLKRVGSTVVGVYVAIAVGIFGGELTIEGAGVEVPAPANSAGSVA